MKKNVFFGLIIFALTTLFYSSSLFAEGFDDPIIINPMNPSAERGINGRIDSQEEDIYIFYGVRDFTYYIRSDKNGDSEEELFNSVIQIYSYEQELLERQNNFFSEKETLNWDCPTNGIYYIGISDFGYLSEGKGNYTLELLTG